MSQVWNPNQYANTGNFVPTLGEPLLELLQPKPGMNILDLGCGNGTLTLKIMESGAKVTGLDASLDMVNAARDRGIEAIHQSAYDMAFDQEFDAIFSNAALHWMTEAPQQVLDNVARALKPGGRFIGEMGGEGNIHHIQVAQREALAKRGLDLDRLSPKFFPSLETYRSMLITASFSIEQIQLFQRPTQLPNGVKGWLAVFSTGVLTALPSHDIDAFLQEVEEATKPYLLTKEGWFADYVRLRFVACKPVSPIHRDACQRHNPQ